jgi:hypothetical protein
LTKKYGVRKCGQDEDDDVMMMDCDTYTDDYNSEEYMLRTIDKGSFTYQFGVPGDQ